MIRRQVSIPHRGAYARMSSKLFHRRQVHSSHHQPRHKSVSERVKITVLDSRPLQDLRKVLSVVIRTIKRLPVPVVKDESSAHGEIVQDLFQLTVDWDGPGLVALGVKTKLPLCLK